jgi:hypothetical protein
MTKTTDILGTIANSRFETVHELDSVCGGGDPGRCAEDLLPWLGAGAAGGWLGAGLGGLAGWATSANCGDGTRSPARMLGELVTGNDGGRIVRPRSVQERGRVGTLPKPA